MKQSLIDELWNGEKGICFFVHFGRCFWVVDDKYNFCLDAEKDYRAYLAKGHMTESQYALACQEFRGGILRLTAENFKQYLDQDGDRIFSQKSLREILEQDSNPRGCLHSKVERYYLSGISLDQNDFHAANSIASRLPAFYVNFDRKIYIHMDFGRAHEDLAYPDWFAKCTDFGFLIPDDERYWILGSRDYWKYRFLQAI